jgi:hypothetical protein
MFSSSLCELLTRLSTKSHCIHIAAFELELMLDEKCARLLGYAFVCITFHPKGRTGHVYATEKTRRICITGSVCRLQERLNATSMFNASGVTGLGNATHTRLAKAAGLRSTRSGSIETSICRRSEILAKIYWHFTWTQLRHLMIGLRRLPSDLYSRVLCASRVPC